MLHRIHEALHGWKRVRALRHLRLHADPEDLPSLAVKIANQRSLGTRIGKRCRLLGRIDPLNPQLVEIGNFCVIGTECMLLAHGPGFDGKTPLVIGDYTYIGYRVTILPRVRIGAGCIIGAGAIVTRNIPDGKVVAGNPARVLRDVTKEELADIRYRMENDLFFGKDGKVS